MNNLSFATFCVLVSIGMHADAAPCQAQEQSERSVIQIALVTAIDRDSARAIVIKAGNRRGLDLILVTTQTTPADLAKAVAVLRRSRSDNSGRSIGEARAYVYAATGERSPNIAFAQTELERLRKESPRPVRDFGRVPTIMSRVSR